MKIPTPIICLYLVSILFFSNTQSFGAKTALAMTESSGLEQLIQKFQNNDLNPTLAEPVTRPHLSGSGETIIVNGDSLQVFQYSATGTALEEASALVQRYADGTKSTLWKKEIHIYANDNMVVFYLGTNKNILNSLDQSTELSSLQAQK